MAPRIQTKTGTAQEPRKENSPDWIGDGCIHSASNPIPTRANTEFDPKRMMLAVVAQKIGGKTSGQHESSEREKSPDRDAEREKPPCAAPQIAIRHTLPEEAPIAGAPSEDQEMETSPTSVPISTRVEKAVALSGAYFRPFVGTLIVMVFF
eukprot:Em0003g1433a